MHPPAGSASPPRDPRPAGRPVGARWLFLLLAAVLLAYAPSLQGDFLWDDAGHVTSPDLQSVAGLARIWCEPGATQQYYPLLHTAFWLEHRVWGDSTTGYRLITALWHAVSAWLLVVLLRRLAVPGALLAGFLLALHPVAVESVAWIAEQKNTLSTLLCLLAALAWLRFEDERRPSRYLIATGCFVAALLTKSVTATLPAALLVLAWWRRGRLAWRADLLPLLPWLLLGVAGGLFTAWFERTGIGAQGAEFNLGLLERSLQAGRILWFYLGKLLWPANLAFFYPRWTIDVASPGAWLFPALALALVGLLAWQARHARGPLAVALLFGGTLFPALGFVNVYPFLFSPVADHFQYLASLSVVSGAAAGLTLVADRTSRPAGRLRFLAAALLVGALGVLTWRQAGHYTDSVTLHRATLAVSPDSWITHHNLAAELAARGDPVAALPHARRAVELKADFPETLNTLADALTRTGSAAEALPLLDRALQLHPRYAPAENTRGLALTALGRREEAARHFQQAITLQPRLAEAHYNLGLTHAERGDFGAAIPCFTRAAALRPDHAATELNWGLALALSQRLPEARPHFERALALQPESAALHQSYGRALLAGSDPDAALSHFRIALELEPERSGLHRDLATTLQQLGRTDEARAHLLEASKER